MLLPLAMGATTDHSVLGAVAFVGASPALAVFDRVGYGSVRTGSLDARGRICPLHLPSALGVFSSTSWTTTVGVPGGYVLDVAVSFGGGCVFACTLSGTLSVLGDLGWSASRHACNCSNIFASRSCCVVFFKPSQQVQHSCGSVLCYMWP